MVSSKNYHITPDDSELAQLLIPLIIAQAGTQQWEETVQQLKVILCASKLTFD